MCSVLNCSVMSDSLWPVDHSPPGSSVLGIFHARILEWAAISYSRRYSQPSDGHHASCIDTPPALTGRFFTSTTWEASPGVAVPNPESY